MAACQLDPNMFEQLVDCLPAGVIVIDTKGSVSWVNKNILDLFPANITGSKWSDILQSSFRYFTKDGNDITLCQNKKVSVKTQSLPNGNGQLVLIYDQTESRAAQDKLNQSIRMSLLGKMAANVAHQIRNPLLTGLLILNQMLDSDASNAQNIQKLKKIKKQLGTIEKEVEDILLFAKGGTEVLQQINVSLILQEAVNSCSMNDKSIKIDYIPPKKNYIIQQGNSHALEGAIRNLIENAIEASSVGHCVKVYVQDEKNNIKILIEDYGKGINKDEIKDVIEPFVTNKAKGTGLGLTIANCVVKNHQGNLKINSTESVGTTVIIDLPILNTVSYLDKSQRIGTYYGT